MAQGHLWNILNGTGAPREHPKRPGSASGAFETAQWRKVSIRIGPEVPWEHPKHFEGIFGASKTARGCLRSFSKGHGASRKHQKRPSGARERPKQPWSTPGVSERSRCCLRSIRTALGCLRSIRIGTVASREHPNGLGVPGSI